MKDKMNFLDKEKEESPFYYDPEKHGGARVDRMKFFASIGSMELDEEAEEQLMQISETAANPPSEKAQKLLNFTVARLESVYRSNDYQSPSHPVGNAKQFFAGEIDNETLDEFDNKLNELIQIIQTA